MSYQNKPTYGSKSTIQISPLLAWAGLAVIVMFNLVVYAVVN